MNQREALQLIKDVQRQCYEGAKIEVKAAHQGLPSRLYQTLSAFANSTGGGIVILGLDERQNFAAVGVAEPQQRLAELGDMASRMIPPLRLAPMVAHVEDKPVIVFEVPECPYQHKPCHYGPNGMNSGSYIRVSNSSRRMTDYEIFTYVSSRGQPTYDREPVCSATLENLDREIVTDYLAQVKREQPRRWRRLRLDEKSFSEQLQALNLAVRSNGDLHPTLAGLLTFGIWPQQQFPSLIITFVHYPGSKLGTKGPRGERFLDNRKFEGRLDEMLDNAVRRVVSNMRHGTLIEGIFHRTLSEYPGEAVREAITNTIAHRDYSPQARGSQVRIEMYTNRLVIITPGGLHGPVNEDNLEKELATRNQLLVHLLEETGMIENRGSGIPMMIAAMREAHLEPPQFHDSRASFRVIFKNHTLLNPETVTWLNQFADYPLTAAQRMALAYLRTNPSLTNSDYRRLNNTSTVKATQELRELVDLELIEMHGTRRWANYTLLAKIEIETPQQVTYATRGLNARQMKAMRYLKKHREITSALYCEKIAPDISQRMARKDLKGLEEQGLVIRIGRTRGARYVLSISE